MLLMGDEVRRTQRGNNNAYAQDNEISWFDWNAAAKHADLLRFVRGLIHLHQRSPLFRDRRFWSEPGGTDVVWHGVQLYQPDFGDQSHSLAFELMYPDSQSHLHVMLNAYWEPLVFELPELPAEEHWQRLVDTALSTPADLSDPPVALPIDKRQYQVQARSSVILVAGLDAYFTFLRKQIIDQGIAPGDTAALNTPTLNDVLPMRTWRLVLTDFSTLNPSALTRVPAS